MRLNEMRQKGPRAGVYPVYTDPNGEVWVFLMIPSKAEYGGAEPQMGKGRVDDGETPEEGAFREGQEELGLRMDNIKRKWLITKEQITGLDGYYDMSVYGAEIIDPKAFDAHSDESGWVGWVKFEDALTQSRQSQVHFLKAIK
jgi:8-oxo-dGTP pyrophosphatase MutT (NUDIX family)